VAHVVFHPVGEAGHIRPVLALAAQLRSRGHAVSFIGWGATRALVEERGERFLPLFDEMLIDSTEENPRVALIDRYLDGTIARALAALDADLLLVDTSLPESSLAARLAGVAEGRISIVFPQGYRPTVPPLSSNVVAGAGPGRVARANLDWLRLVSKQWGALAIRRTQARIRSRASDARYDYLRRLRKASGTRRSDVSYTAEFAEFVVRASPELVLCPSELEFATRVSPDIQYLEPCIDWGSVRPLTDEFAHLDDRPLVLCALGTQTHRYPAAAATLRSVIDVLRDRPDLQGVVATGDASIDATTVPSNVLTVPHMPQLALLGRAAVFVTHGGLSSVKESIVQRVPMLVVPQSFDQPGNAARVVYHGLGRRLVETDATAVATELDDLLGDCPERRTVRAWGERWRELSSSTPAALGVESLLARR
jgi:zeaxanthin glucosyltransferase